MWVPDPDERDGVQGVLIMAWIIGRELRRREDEVRRMLERLAISQVLAPTMLVARPRRCTRCRSALHDVRTCPESAHAP